MSFLLQSPSTIEGIGAQRSAALAAGGIETIAEMFAARAPRVHDLLPGTSPAQIGSWFAAAVLLRVDDVTPDLAEAFVQAGVRSASRLAEAGLRTLELAVKDARDANRLGEEYSLYKLAEIQRNAWRVRDRGMLAGRILDQAGTPVAGAVVDIGRYEMTVDAAGRYAFDSVPEGRVTPTVTVPGRLRPLHALPRQVQAAKLAGPFVHRIGAPPATPVPLLELHEMDGHILTPGPRYTNREVTLPLTQFRDGTYFLVRELRSDGTYRLLSLYKRRTGTVTYIERADVSPSDLPAGPIIGSVLQLTSGALVLTPLGAADVAELKYQKWLETHPTTTRRVLEVDLSSPPGGM